jgi:hypothetical protein
MGTLFRHDQGQDSGNAGWRHPMPLKRGTGQIRKKPMAPFKFHVPSNLLFLALAFLVLPVVPISAESGQTLAKEITGVWVGRDIVYSSDVDVDTTFRADGTMSRCVIFSTDGRVYKLSTKGRWKVEQGQLVSVGESFSGQTERSVDEIIAVTDKNLLLRAENGRLIHFIRK